MTPCDENDSEGSNHMSHKALFERDVATFEAEGYAVARVGRGAIVDGRILVCSSDRLWKIVLQPNWYPYSDVQEIIQFLKNQLR
jgi:hypothetical protein